MSLCILGLTRGNWDVSFDVHEENIGARGEHVGVNFPAGCRLNIYRRPEVLPFVRLFQMLIFFFHRLLGDISVVCGDREAIVLTCVRCVLIGLALCIFSVS